MTDFWRSEEETQSESERKPASPHESVLFKKRTITLFGEIDHEKARNTVEKLLALSYQGDDPITLFIGSPGGHVESGDAIFDAIRFIQPVVRTVGTGWVGSIAAHIYIAPDKEHRYALPNTRFLIHQPFGGFGGDASDIEIQAKEILKTRERINRVISEQTGQPLEQVNLDTDRDHWMTAEEAQKYGVVGKIIRSTSELSN